MGKQPIRRSDRVSLELPIRVWGEYALGREFTITTRTLLLSRHGAKILLDTEFVPHRTFSVRCLHTNQEAEARLVGFIREECEGLAYGIEFLDPGVNLWGIGFPPLSESAKAVARLLLECPACRTVELSYLGEIEALAFQTHSYLPRPCQSCNDVRLWKPSGGTASEKQSRFPVPPATTQQAMPETPLRIGEERKGILFSLMFPACVCSPQSGEEVVLTEKISREGFRFRSGKSYAVDDLVGVAVPYTRESGNVFVPARITHAEGKPGQRLTQYGVSYIRTHEGWPGD